MDHKTFASMACFKPHFHTIVSLKKDTQLFQFLIYILCIAFNTNKPDILQFNYLSTVFLNCTGQC